VTTPARPDQARAGDAGKGVLLRRSVRLEQVTPAWNAAGIAVLAVAAARARSVALVGFGLDSLVGIGASTVVLWELSGTGPDRNAAWGAAPDRLRLLGACRLPDGAVRRGAPGRLPPPAQPSRDTWTAATAVVMVTLRGGKARAGRALGNPVLITEGRVTLVDAVLAAAVLLGLALNTLPGAWWADPLAALVSVCYGLREARGILTGQH